MAQCSVGVPLCGRIVGRGIKPKIIHTRVHKASNAVCSSTGILGLGVTSLSRKKLCGGLRTVSCRVENSREHVVASTGDASTTSAIDVKALKVPAYILLWYGFNVIFNILNKQTLNAFPCPWLVSLLQLVASGSFMCLLWVTKLQPVPKLTLPVIKGLSLVSLFHTIGHVAACISFSKVAVSFGHVVKSTEPVFSLIFSGPLLGQTNPLYVWASVVPIVLGCSLSALKEVSFSWAGFNNAMISNLGMVLRGIYSKKMMVDFKAIDGINLFGLMSIFSILYCAPLAVVMESHTWHTASLLAMETLGKGRFIYLLTVGGLFFHLYNQAAYMVFAQGITPVTFSVANTMKRVSVVVCTVAFFRNPVSLLNWVGSGMAIMGTLLYSLARTKATEEKALKST